MRKLLNIFLFAIVGICLSQTSLHADAKQENLTSKIESKYTLKNKKHPLGLFILENGYTLYSAGKKNKGWERCDELVVKKAYPQEEDDFDIEKVVCVTNQTQEKKSCLLRFGWCDKTEYVISSICCKKEDGEDIVSIKLDDGTKFKISYNDEKAYAKDWKKGEKILVIINNFDDPQEYAGCPFPLSTYNPNWHYELINLDAKHSLPSGFIEIVP